MEEEIAETGSSLDEKEEERYDQEEEEWSYQASDVHFDDIPTDHEETSRETIWSWALIQGHALDSIPHLVHGELSINDPQVSRGDPKEVEV
jgi:hypothetical protein